MIDYKDITIDHLYESKSPRCVSFNGVKYYNDRSV
jgi:hypothetical protein